MAYTKTHPIKSTLKAALDYILNPEKTEDKMLASSYACGTETAYMEFEYTRKHSPERGTHLARHLIQSFAPGEATPEQAHEIGQRLAEEVLGGKYEFVLTTHINTDSIHNHIIFNAVSFVDYKKYQSNKRTYRNIRKISDNLCKEHGLSVIRPSGEKGKSYIEHTAALRGTSWKAQLKSAIDKTISRSTDFEDFLLRMELAGYEIKRGKYISFKAPGQERFTRGKTIGINYTEDSIKGRIANRPVKKPRTESCRINLIIDIQNSLKAQESKGYEYWAKIQNLKQASKTLNFLTENNIATYEALESRTKEIHSDFETVSSQIKALERRMSDTAVLMKYVTNYNRLKPVYQKYQTAKDKTAFEKKYQSEIILFEAAAKNLKGKNSPPTEVLKISYTSMTEEKAKLYEEYKKLKKQSAEIDTVKANVDTLLNRPKERETEIEK